MYTYVIKIKIQKKIFPSLGLNFQGDNVWKVHIPVQTAYEKACNRLNIKIYVIYKANFRIRRYYLGQLQ